MSSTPALGFPMLDLEKSELAFFISLCGVMWNSFLFYMSVFTVKMLRGVLNHLK